MKPMLASPVDWDICTFPKRISTKLDGIRTVIIDGVAYSRSLKPIPNQFIQSKIGHLNGYDGELIVGSPTDPLVYRTSNSGIMSKAGEPDFTFFVFDRWDMDAPWVERFNSLSESHPRVKVLPHMTVHNAKDAIEVTEHFLNQGYEGAMLRDPNSPYKHGRATTKQGWLLKVKEWEDSEMMVEGQTERMHNTNAATRNELGYIERSSAKDGKVGLDTMGTLYGRDIHDGRPVEVGTGFTDDERAYFWSLDPVGLIVRYRRMKYSGGYDNVRMAVYEGLRDPADL